MSSIFNSRIIAVNMDVTWIPQLCELEDRPWSWHVPGPAGVTVEALIIGIGLWGGGGI